MKIVSIEAIPVTMPFLSPVSDSWGVYHASNHGIVVVRGESGAYGVGEIAFAWFGGAHSLCSDVNRYWAERLIGLDITDITRLNETLDYLCSFSKRHLLAKAGVEMAVWDLLGKTLGLPVCRLIGGRLRDKIALTGGIPMDTVERMVEVAKRRVAEGYRELKLKVGLDDGKDIAAVRAVRYAIPDEVKLRVDANMAWKDAKQAKGMIDEMAGYGVDIVEQPLPDTQLADLSWLRSHTSSQILIDEGVWDVHDAKRNLDAGAADMLHVYISEAGGVDGARKIFDLAALHGVNCTIGSMPEGRIGAAASAHIAAAMANLSPRPSDIRGFTAYADDVVQEQLEIKDGMLEVPDRPGLGVTVDFEKLESLKSK